MIALTKILIAALISIFCSFTGLNLSGNENTAKKDNISIQFESPQILSCPKNIKGETV